MTVDMRLISIKDGGRFAMSWMAGTNPKALRSNNNRTHVYTVDVPQVCKDIMKSIKRKNNSLSFRILFRLCFGTIKIFHEQVQHLYNVTLNFVCFNTFFLKQYSRKRSSATVVNNENKRRRRGSIDSVDITNLLMESEVYNEYSEEKFEFPQEISSTREKKKTTSTCVHIKEITIRQISWDYPQPDDEDAFGEASQDEKNMLLYEMSAKEDDLMSEQSSVAQKRKSPSESHSGPAKKCCLEGILNNSFEEVRCAPGSINDEPVSEFNIDYRCQSVAETQTSIQDVGERDMTLDETFPNQQMHLDQSHLQCDPLDESFNVLPVRVHQNEVSTSLQAIPTFARDDKSQARKRRKSHLIIDRSTTLAEIDLDYCKKNVWENCRNRAKKEHMVKRLYHTPLVTLHPGPSRFSKLLGNFKKNIKTVQKQIDDHNRLLLIEEILGDEFETYKSEFRLTATKKSRPSTRNASNCTQFRSNFKETPMLPVIDENIDLNNNCREFDEPSGKNEIPDNCVKLKCSLDKINLNKIIFNFPNDATTQSSRSNWGKEGILRKLLSLWKTKDHHISMTTLIVGANRINAALAFHTLLDLAGRQYVEIIKDDNNSIQFIHMGSEVIKKINKLCI